LPLLPLNNGNIQVGIQLGDEDQMDKTAKYHNWVATKDGDC